MTATNFARVTVSAREITVTADDKTKYGPEADPAFTWTAEIESSEPQLLASEGEKAKNLLAKAVSATRGEEKAPGVYEIVVTGPATLDGGNFAVTYVSGTLTVSTPTISAIRIVDHKAAGGNRVRLAFSLKFTDAGGSADYVRALDRAGCIKVACATSEAALADAVATPVRLCTPEAPLDLNEVWVTVDVPDDAGWPLLWKIVIEDAAR